MSRPAGWSGALGEYLTLLRAGGRAPGTVRLHRHYLEGLAADHASPWRVRYVDLLAYMANPSWSPETRKSARAVLRGFYRWAHGMGYLSDDPAFSLPGVRVPAGKPHPAPEHLVRRLVSADDDRLAFMAELMAYAGMRAAEVARVHGHDLDGDVLRVIGKGGKVRDVPIVNASLLGRLEALGDAWAFPNRQGSHISAGHVSKLMGRAMPAGWSGHALRHRAGTNVRNGSGDLLATMTFLGHSRPETTIRYTLLPDDAVRAAVVFTELTA